MENQDMQYQPNPQGQLPQTETQTSLPSSDEAVRNQIAQDYLDRKAKVQKRRRRQARIDLTIAVVIYAFFAITPVVTLWYVFNLSADKAAVLWIGTFAAWRFLNVGNKLSR